MLKFSYLKSINHKDKSIIDEHLSQLSDVVNGRWIQNPFYFQLNEMIFFTKGTPKHRLRHLRRKGSVDDTSNSIKEKLLELRNRKVHVYTRYTEIISTCFQ